MEWRGEKRMGEINSADTSRREVKNYGNLKRNRLADGEVKGKATIFKRLMYEHA